MLFLSSGTVLLAVGNAQAKTNIGFGCQIASVFMFFVAIVCFMKHIRSQKGKA